MSTLRYDPTTNDWVLFAPERARRTRDLVASQQAPSEPPIGNCPFCPGHETLSSPEVLALRQRPQDPWSVRVIANKFPALGREGGENHVQRDGLFRQLGGYGVHEVIIESPDHSRFLGHQPPDQVERLLSVLHSRFLRLMEDERIQTIVIFKNHGHGAGTSLRHPHWQLIAMPVVPRLLRTKHSIATEYFDRMGRCLYCVLLEDERKAKTRVLAENDEYTAVLPYASHLAYQVRILPRRHEASFGAVPESGLKPLATLLREVLARLHAALGDPDFNLTVNTAPRGDEGKRYFLWHIDILPRLATPAGFEMGSGMSINTVLPEDAATFLKAVRLP